TNPTFSSNPRSLEKELKSNPDLEIPIKGRLVLLTIEPIQLDHPTDGPCVGQPYVILPFPIGQPRLMMGLTGTCFVAGPRGMMTSVQLSGGTTPERLSSKTPPLLLGAMLRHVSRNDEFV
ncbi:hypothetical protein AVEN_114849-1, partial [Araneus ventricosus]